jgi:phage tail sheath protein FI
MPTYIAPGVHIEEISKTLPSIKGMETAIPILIGFTEKIKDENDHSLINVQHV